MKFENMKIYGIQRADEVLSELRRVGYKQISDIRINHVGVSTDTKGNCCTYMSQSYADVNYKEVTLDYLKSLPSAKKKQYRIVSDWTDDKFIEIPSIYIRDNCLKCRIEAREIEYEI